MGAYLTPVYGQDEQGRLVQCPPIEAHEVGPGNYVSREIHPFTLWKEPELLSWCASNGRSLVLHKKEQGRCHRQ